MEDVRNTYIILRDIEKFANEFGIIITYETINQIENGNSEKVESGAIPKYTYTVYVEKDGRYIHSESCDSIYEALKSGMIASVDYLNNIVKEAKIKMNQTT